jgi:hypothetical protein
MEEKSLMQYLEDINTYKEAIKNAINEKGGEHYMDNVSFSDYAVKINELQLSSGDEPSTPTPSADYIYSNGYLTNGTETNEIINFIQYEIVLDDEGKCAFELTCPDEISGYESDGVSLGMMDVIFTVDIPTTYKISNFEWLDETGATPVYVVIDYKENPRHSNIVRNGVTYKSYVRQVSDNNDYGSYDVQFAPLKYKITIEK